MRRKLYIINNGMKDLRGHYFETSVSIAEASHALGLHAVLAAHVDCPGDIVPDEVEFHAAFTTDHWMSEPPPPQPTLGGLRCDPILLASNTIGDLIDGRIGFNEYLAARFESNDGSTHRGLTQHDHVGPASRSLRAQLKRLAKGVLPPAIVAARPALKRVLRQSLPPFVASRLKSSIARISYRDVQRNSTPPHRSALLLARVGAPQEYEYSLRFQQDLERLLCLTGCTGGDHVFLPTAHGRELCAILQLMSRWPAESQPMFHLEFRHPLNMRGDGTLTENDNIYGAYRAFFEIARRDPIKNNLRLYTDSDKLRAEYERFSGLEFGVLPIPFRSHLLGTPSREVGPICIGFYGDVRDEKGFHWLPDLVESMIDEYVRPGRVRFLIQASLIHPEHEPRSKEALEKLKRYPDDMVRLVGLDGPLSPDSYFRMVSATDLLVCPYHPATYRCRTSGTLTEAIAFGIPTVVPHGSWLASQQPAGSGTTFIDLESFTQAVRQICDDYSSYQSRARAGRHSWLQLHSPERLIKALLGETANCGSSDEKVA